MAADIKVSAKDLITAFGQACAYKLSAHRVYLVVPRSASQNILRRLDASAINLGIGLVVFDPNPRKPNFSVMVRAGKGEVDYFYTNDMMDRVGGLFGTPHR
ncbi:hypothetical protein ABIE09_002345 [Lysobacter enzymogenes]|uniref:hypothetical protein n=1 Tax=Lysobacter enzymogenes TaxID=69 RepID=UPI003396F442